MILIIPARGGSKRIPRKNIKPFLGDPIITYPIRVALESGLFSRVVVSTDDPEIEIVAHDAGAVPHRRRSDLAGDRVSVEDVCRDVLECEVCFDGDERFACTFPTSVFTTADHWCRAADSMASGADMVYSASHYDATIYRALNADGWVFPEYQDSRTQDCPEAWHDAGQFYMLRRWAPSFLNVTPRVAVMMPRAVDIDEPNQWAEAERAYKELHP